MITSLPEGTVDLWWLDLTAPVSGDCCLSAAEEARGARFKGQASRDRFVARRVALHRIVGRYGDIVHSTSSSGSIGVIAVARSGPIGVDIADVRTNIDLLATAHRFATPREMATIGLLPREERQRAAFALWARKEAYLKAIGTGFERDPSLVTLDVGGWTFTTVGEQSGLAGALATREEVVVREFASPVP